MKLYEQMCVGPAGQLRTLDMGGFNLTCTWSQISTSVAILNSLEVLDLSNNPRLTVLPPWPPPRLSPRCCCCCWARVSHHGVFFFFFCR